MTVDEILVLALKILTPVIGAIWLYQIILKPNIKGARNRRQPIVTIRATVVGREKNMDNVVYSGYYNRDGGDVHLLIFRTEEGQQVTLTVPRMLYNTTPDGTTGVLTYQGTKCERFDADKSE